MFISKRAIFLAFVWSVLENMLNVLNVSFWDNEYCDFYYVSLYNQILRDNWQWHVIIKRQYVMFNTKWFEGRQGNEDL